MTNKERLEKKTKTRWNSMADKYNQWDDISGEEREELIEMAKNNTRQGIRPNKPTELPKGTAPLPLPLNNESIGKLIFFLTKLKMRGQNNESA